MVAPRNATALRMRMVTSGLTVSATAGLADGEAARRATTVPPRVAENGTVKWPAASVVAVPTSAARDGDHDGETGGRRRDVARGDHLGMPDGRRVVEREREGLAGRLGRGGQARAEEGERRNQPSHGEHPFRSRLSDSC